MNEFLKRATSGLFIILWIFSTILYFSKFFILSMITSLFIIYFIEWPKVAKNYQSLFFIYPTIPFVLLIYLQHNGYKMPNLLTFASCFLFDSSSYFFGKLLGKHKIAPTISRKKTIEGCIGGCLTLIIAYLAFVKWQTKTATLFSLITIENLLIPIAISLLAFSGDLFESYFKRKSGLKDFGNTLPGHGGLLDRFDSVLFVVVFVFMFRNYLIKIFV